ncbi:MAG: hypothetical protein Hyperionvirus49_5, partial [Hyperionvirus sp.]
VGSNREVKQCLAEGIVKLDNYCFENALINKYNIMKLMFDNGFRPNLEKIVSIGDSEKRMLLFKLFQGV